MPRKFSLYFSIAVIAGYWAWQLINLNQELPSAFSQLTIQIAWNKTIHVFAILVLLWLEGDDLGQLGFKRELWPKQILTGVLIGAIMFLVMNVGLNSLLKGLFPRPAGDNARFLNYFSDPRTCISGCSSEFWAVAWWKS